MRREKRFRVSGFDTNDDRHVFETDDRARAEATRDQWKEDLQHVHLERVRLV